MPRHPDSTHNPASADKAASADQGGPFDPVHGLASCDRVHQHLEALVDGELEQPQEAAIRRHLATCAPCRLAHAEAVQIALSLRNLPELTCPPRVTRAVLAQATAEATAQSSTPPSAVRNFPARSLAPATPRRLARRRSAAWRPALAAALVTAAVGATLFFQSRTPAPAPGTTTVQMSEREVAEAEIKLKLALAYLSEVGREAGFTVRDEMVKNIFAPTHRALQ